MFGEEQRPGGRMGDGPKNDPLKAQLRSDSGRSSKIIRDRQGIEAVVMVPGAGRLVLSVDSAGGYSLRGRPEGKESGEAASRDLIVVGVVRANEVVAVRPGEPSAEHELDP
jgi:hypothetical protein